MESPKQLPLSPAQKCGLSWTIGCQRLHFTFVGSRRHWHPYDKSILHPGIYQILFKSKLAYLQLSVLYTISTKLHTCKATFKQRCWSRSCQLLLGPKTRLSGVKVILDALMEDLVQHWENSAESGRTITGYPLRLGILKKILHYYQNKVKSFLHLLSM